jgi:hypothetical protein
MCACQGVEIILMSEKKPTLGLRRIDKVVADQRQRGGARSRQSGVEKDDGWSIRVTMMDTIY